MNYERQYNLLIEKAVQRGTVEGYKERHHIVPRCMGGSNKKENLVELTAREHYVAHRLLYMWHRTPPLAWAWSSMCRTSTNHKGRIFTNRQYERARLAISESGFSEEHKDKLRTARKKQVVTIETREKLSEAGKRRVWSEETRRKISEALKGKPMREQTKQKLRDANLGKSYPNRVNPPKTRGTDGKFIKS